MGNSNYPPRSTLSPAVSTALTDAHNQTGGTYREVAAVLRVSYPYWWRLCRGERAPTTHVAFRIIDTLDLDQDTADLLLDECVDRGEIVAQHDAALRISSPRPC